MASHMMRILIEMQICRFAMSFIWLYNLSKAPAGVIMLNLLAIDMLSLEDVNNFLLLLLNLIGQ